jgi:hypothetical protein
MSRSAEFASGASDCDFCGQRGHDYTAHPEAVADVRAWQGQLQKEEFPFGDHREH